MRNTPIVHKDRYPAVGMRNEFPLRNLEQRDHICQKASMFSENMEESHLLSIFQRARLAD